LFAGLACEATAGHAKRATAIATNAATTTRDTTTRFINILSGYPYVSKAMGRKKFPKRAFLSGMPVTRSRTIETWTGKRPRSDPVIGDFPIHVPTLGSAKMHLHPSKRHYI